MRVSEETLSRGLVGTGWWASGLLVGAYNTTHQQNFSLLSHARQRKNLYYGGRVCARAGGGVV